MKAAPINISYQGDRQCDVEHTPSTTRLRIDVSKEPNAQGKSFSPTDLLAAAVGSSVVSTIAGAGEERELAIAGMKVQVDKQPRNGCIDELHVRVTVPRRLSAEDRKLIEEAARKCPCYASLHPDIDAHMSFAYVGA